MPKKYELTLDSNIHIVDRRESLEVCGMKLRTFTFIRAIGSLAFGVLWIVALDWAWRVS